MFNSEDFLKKHPTKRHGHPFTCDICKAVSTNQFQFFEHLKVHYEGRSNSSSHATPGNKAAIKDQITTTFFSVSNMQIHPDNTVVPTKSVNKARIRSTKKTDSSRNNYITPVIVDAPKNVIFVCIWCNKSYTCEKTYVTHVETCTNHPDPVTEDEQFEIENTKTKGARKLKSKKEEPEEIVFSDPSPYKLMLIENLENVTNSLGNEYEADHLEDKDAFEDGLDDIGKDDILDDDANAAGSMSKSKNKFAIGQRQQEVLKCNTCQKIFNHRNSLVYHMKSHTGERPHKCQLCSKSFFSTSALKVHMRLHSGEKPYQCDYCGRHFRQWGDLRYHVISIHSDIRQYQCGFCGKDFARNYSLVVHRRIHTGERNYKCEFCDKCFRASSYLQNHRRVHTGEKRHACTICRKPFRVRSDMKRHMATHNPDNKNTHKPATVGNADQVNQIVATIEPQNGQQIAQAVRNGTQTTQVQETQVPTQKIQQILEEIVFAEDLSEGMPINITSTQDGCANSSLEAAPVTTLQLLQLREGHLFYSNGPCDVPVDPVEAVTILDTDTGALYAWPVYMN